MPLAADCLVSTLRDTVHGIYACRVVMVLVVSTLEQLEK
jgi:hypothetical protein